MTPLKPHTRFASTVSPFTGMVPIKEVAIPEVPKIRKGRTKYDAQFEKLLLMKSGLEFPNNSFVAVRRAFQRFLNFRELRGKVVVRQHLNKETGMVTLWLEKKDAVPNVRSMDASRRNKKD
jgi:hypothetical protein